MDQRHRSAPLNLDQFSGFTPGPWCAGSVMWDRGQESKQILAGTAAPLVPVGVIRGPRAAADADLIAAAPSLLDECRRQRAALERLLDQHPELAESLQ